MNIIKAATMENFRGYADRNNTIRFRPGINLVLGDNATGKSTIVTSILFNLLHKKIDIARFEDYRTIEPQDLQNFKSGVTITGIDGKEYTIEKILRGNNLNIKIKCDGEELKKSGELELKRQKDAQRFILDKFGVREEILEDILVQIQDPVKLLWPVREAADVGKELSKLLRLEPLQNIYTNAKSAGKLLEEKAESWEKDARDTREQIEKLGLLPPAEYKKEKRKLERIKNEFDKQVDLLLLTLTKLKQKKEGQRGNLRKLQEKSGELKGKKGRINKLSQELKGKRKPKKTAEELRIEKDHVKRNEKILRTKAGEIQTKIGELNSSKEEAVKQKEKLNQKIKPLKNKHNRLVKELNALGIKEVGDAEKIIKSRQIELREIREKIGGLRGQFKIEKEYKSILSKAKAECPVCDTALSTKQRKKILADKEKLIESLKLQIPREESKSRTSERIIDLLDQMKSTLKELFSLTEQLSEANKRYRDATKKFPTFSKKRKLLEDRLQKIEISISKIDEQIKLAEKFEEINELERESKILKKELKALPRLEKSVTNLGDKIENVQGKLTQINGDRRELIPKIQSLERELKNAIEWYNNLETLKKRAKVSYEMAKEVQLASEAARLSLHEIFTNYSDIINANLAWIWPRLYARPDLKNIQLSVEIKEVKEDEEKTLIPEVQLVRMGISGDKIPFNTISSHGQRVLASIAFRIAFLNLLWRTSVPRILVLDEPTIWIDDKNRERLGQLLASLVKEIKEGGIKIDQVIVISHDPVFLNAVDPEGIKHICVKNDEGFCEVSTTIT